jgi:maleate isomerase
MMEESEMSDTLGWRMKIGVVAPATNSIVQPELDQMRPRGVTNQLTRVVIPETPVASPEELVEITQSIRGSVTVALDTVMGCLPSTVILALGAETLWDGVLVGDDLQKHFEERLSVNVILGWSACLAAMRKYGAIHRIGVITPYLPSGDAQVRRFFTDAGFEVVNLLGLRCASPALMAHEPLDKLRRAVRDLDDPSIELIIQVGTNLPFARVAAEAEAWLHKPVIATNVCTYWHALRRFGIDDKIDGFGSLLSEY